MLRYGVKGVAVRPRPGGSASETGILCGHPGGVNAATGVSPRVRGGAPLGRRSRRKHARFRMIWGLLGFAAGAMAGTGDIRETLADVSRLLRAMLPGVAACGCIDRTGRVLWSDGADGSFKPIAAACRKPLQALLAGTGANAEPQLLPHGDERLFLWPLAAEGQSLLGLLVVRIGAAAGALDMTELVAAARPALNVLQRDLQYRLNLRQAEDRLSAQVMEETLTREIDGLLTTTLDFPGAMQSLVSRCRHHLGSESVWVALPELRQTWIAGEGVNAVTADAAAQAMLTLGRDVGRVAREVHDGWLWMPIALSSGHAAGVFAVSVQPAGGVPDRRIRRIVRFVATQTAALIEREFDPLTLLMSWPRFAERIATARCMPERPLVLVMDVDQLHVINDSLGRATGDDVLRRIALALRRELPSGALITRIGADDFAALLPDVEDGVALQSAERIAQLMRKVTYQDGDRVFRAVLSAGLGRLEGYDESADGLGEAQTACRAAKDRGGGRIEIFQTGDASIVQRLDDLHQIGYVRQAIESGSLALVAQQLQPLKSGSVAHYFEVLVRMRGENGQLQLPGDFMSAAERYNLMEELDRWVVGSALESIARHRSQLAGVDVRFAINLSGQSLGSSGFQSFVESAIRDSGVPPALLTFEITESVAVTRLNQAQTFMSAIKRLGCRLSLDDFGTGLSSFAYLKLFPVDTLKIDGSFIRDLPANVVSQSVVAAIAEVARVMHLDTVAEFVQDQATVELLGKLNVGYAQGHYVGTTDLLDRQIARCLGNAGAGISAAVTG